MRSATIWLLAVFLVCGLAVTNTAANPSFSRQNDLKCHACHTVWPNLNAFGRNFKENGFRLEPGAAVPDHLLKLDEGTWIEKVPIVSAKLNGRLIDKTEGNDRQLRIFHEAELFLAGNASNNFSFNVTLEAEDELTVDGSHFEVFMDQAFAGWHPREWGNVVLGYGPIFAADPYNSLASGNRRVTRSDKSPLTGSFDSSFAFVEPTQFATFHGRTGGLYYAGSIGTGNDDPEGEDDTDTLGRVAYDIPVLKSEDSDSGLAIGGFFLDATNKDTFGVDLDQDFTRFGIDFNVETGGFQAYGLWLNTDADVDALGTEVSNDAAYVEALYLFQRNNRPTFYPVLRWQSVETNDGADNIDAIAALFGGYLRPNINLNLEYFKTTEHPNPASETYRWTLFFNIGL